MLSKRSRDRVRAAMLCAAMLCAAVGCQVADEARLLEMTALASNEVMLGDNLRVRGDGFVAGAQCRVLLRGELFRPGQLVEALRIELPAVAISATEVEARIPESALPRIESHATFSGSVALRFIAATGASHVSGELRAVHFDIIRDVEDIAQRHAQQRRAQQALDKLGLVLEDEQESDGGLRVNWAREGSSAALASIKQGDLLTHLDGLTLRAIGDFVPAPSRGHVTLRLRPSERPSERQVTLRMGGPAPAMFGESGFLVTLLAVFALMCVVVLAPLPRRVVRFHSSATVDAKCTAPSNASVSLTPGSSASSTSLALTLLWPMVAAVVWIALAISERVGVVVHVPVLAALIGAVRLVLSASAQRGARRAAAMARELGQLLLVLLPLACAGLVAGVLTVSGMVEQQGGAPWQWFLFKAPPLLLAGCVFIGAGRALVQRCREHSQAVALSFAIVLAGTGAAVFLGGWQAVALASLSAIDPFVLGLVLFSAKAGVLALMLASRALTLPQLSIYRWAGLALVSAALSLAWIRVSPSPALELSIGYGLCIGCLALLCMRALRMPRMLSR